MADQERAWAEALAQEQAHQRELLATFRGELGAFARELATTLTALDACVGGFAEVAQAIDTAKTAHRNAGIVADVARRCGKLRPRTRTRSCTRASPQATSRPGSSTTRARFSSRTPPAPTASS